MFPQLLTERGTRDKYELRPPHRLPVSRPSIYRNRISRFCLWSSVVGLSVYFMKIELKENDFADSTSLTGRNKQTNCYKCKNLFTDTLPMHPTYITIPNLYSVGFLCKNCAENFAEKNG